MSYDISFFTVQPGLSIENSFEAKCCSEGEQRFPKTELEETMKLMGIIQQSIPTLQSLESEESLGLIERQSGLEVSFFRLDCGGVSFPYWHENEDLSSIVRQIALVLRILGQHGKYWAQDSQLGRFLDLTDDDTIASYIQEVFLCNQETMKMLKQWFR